MSKKNIPTIFVIFGATGDLIRKKITPAIFHLFLKNELPTFFKIIGVSRRSFSDKEFQDFIFQILTQHKDANTKKCSDFCKLFSFRQLFFQNLEDYKKVAQDIKKIEEKWGVCANKLFYLAVPPNLYEIILKNLVHSGLTEPCSEEEGWTRILIEKPFGKDIKTAQSLEKLLKSLFQEIQIYRVDHYLAKEMIQNILIFRFTNNLFERQWSKESIEKIEIKLLEKIGVEERGSFYDGLGALRDVGQNHLLQMLALVTMDHPIDFQADAIRTKRAEILKTLIPLNKNEIKNFTFRAQYKGYRKIKGVKPNSNTETYFKIRVFLSSPRWRGVPIFLESGKRLKEARKEIVITFKHQTPCLCPVHKSGHYTNKVVIRWEPQEEIVLHFWSKKPGLKNELEERAFKFFYRNIQNKTQYTEEYEKLLLDAIYGDQTLFISTDEVMAMWRFIDPIIKGWQENLVPLHFYEPDTNEILLESERKFNQMLIKTSKKIKKEIGLVGLGRMGSNIARRLQEKGWQVFGYDKNIEAIKKLESEQIITGVYHLQDLSEFLSQPRIIWLMVPAGKSVDEVLFSNDGLINYLDKNDIVIDAGNSFYKDSVSRFQKLQKKGIHFVDVGVSGGPEGVRFGASLMIGGKKELFLKLVPLFYDLAQENGFQFFEGPGAGHFVKMVHNGIEYGMMQAIAEGFTVLKNSKYKFDLAKVADVYNHGSVIQSRLIDWLKKAFELFGNNLKGVSGSVEHTGEGEWTIKTAKELKIKTKVIEDALKFRIRSQKRPSYTGKILTALRHLFGGHSIKD